VQSLSRHFHLRAYPTRSPSLWWTPKPSFIGKLSSRETFVGHQSDLCRVATETTRRALASAAPALINPTTGIVGCCAGAVIRVVRMRIVPPATLSDIRVGEGLPNLLAIANPRGAITAPS
jgi:hypothetical protein